MALAGNPPPTTTRTPLQAWRWAFFVPAVFYIATALATLALGIDHPSGKDYRDLKKEGALKSKGAMWPVIKCGLGNYRCGDWRDGGGL